jgi:glycosyltransferase involved in cell wall biosynthesis
LYRDLELEAELLRTSDIFDPEFYVQQAGEAARPDPAGHYIRTGWLSGLEPNAEFPGSILRPYFEAAGLYGPPVIQWLTLKSAGWALPKNFSELGSEVSLIRSSNLFDEAYYLSRLYPAAVGLDPAIHYLLVGERTGLAPSQHFDPAYYYLLNPDVTNHGVSALLHYIWSGRQEGRNATPFPDLRTVGGIRPSEKPNVLLVMHDSSRTGAPVLGWNIAKHLAYRYNLHTIVLDGGGPLMEEFSKLSVSLYGPFPIRARTFGEMEFSLRKLLDENEFQYAIINSIEARSAIQAFGRRFIPTVLLMHEFASYSQPPETMKAALDWATHIVFPSRLVAASAASVHSAILNQAVHILPQGISAVPASEGTRDEDFALELKKVAAAHEGGAFVVVGAGTVHVRKGVDLFLGVAAALKRRNALREFRFVWVGHGYQPKRDMEYSVYLLEQLERSGLEDTVSFIGELPGLDPVYAIADAFLLSSRLDPLPNVSIDAAVHGLPVVCFRDASGTAEMLLEDKETAQCVVGHLDTEAAAEVIHRLANNKLFYSRVSAATKRFANQSFDMASYVDKLDSLGKTSLALMQQRRSDADVIAADASFDQDMFLGPAQIIESRWNSIIRYLIARAAMGLPDRPVKDHPRRPCPGFHPQVYSADRRLSPEVDPLADFIRCGKPAGRWQTKVIHLENDCERLSSNGLLRVALHAHAYHPEMLPMLVARLSKNRSRCDLLISTDAERKAEKIRAVTESYPNGKVVVCVMPNRGRNIGPFMTGFRCKFSEYDLIGHVHSKRSPEIGDTWREFIWERLVGGRSNAMDRIIAEFEQNRELGLVYPADPHIVGWDRNRKDGETLAVQMGWRGELPYSFDFPLGTMFWARRQALTPLLDLNFTWDKYPDEPVPYDGTVLHALERIVPFSTEIAGYSAAVTHLSPVDW